MVDKQRWRNDARRIRLVLLETWDPIGVRDEPNAQDEYDRYIGGVYRLLTQGASDKELIAYLRSVETGNMGLPGSECERLARTVEALRALDIEKP